MLAALAAAPLLFGVLLAVALGGYLALQFAPDLVRGLRAGSAPRQSNMTHLAPFRRGFFSCSNKSPPDREFVRSEM